MSIKSATNRKDDRPAKKTKIRFSIIISDNIFSQRSNPDPGNIQPDLQPYLRGRPVPLDRKPGRSTNINISLNSLCYAILQI